MSIQKALSISLIAGISLVLLNLFQGVLGEALGESSSISEYEHLVWDSRDWGLHGCLGAGILFVGHFL